MVSPSELSSVEGFDEGLSNELINRASLHLEKINKENLVILKESGLDDYLLGQNFLNTDQLIKLKDKGIKTRDDLADSSSDELIDVLGNLDMDKANEIIIESRNIGLKTKKMEESKDKKVLFWKAFS